jgi:hypothetical protein
MTGSTRRPDDDPIRVETCSKAYIINIAVFDVEKKAFRVMKHDILYVEISGNSYLTNTTTTSTERRPS